MTLARAFARFSQSLDISRIPGPMVDKVRTCLIDYLSAAVGGHDFAWSRQALALAAAEPGSSSVPATQIRTSLQQAVFTCAVLAGSTSQMDTHPESASHPGSVIWPALLPLAEAVDADGADLLAAAIAGYEVNGRLGRAIFGAGGPFALRPTGILGAAAAAAACARLLRLDEDQATAAICIAANTACGLMEWTRAGTTEHIFHAAFAARNAVSATLLACAGTRAAEATLEGPNGLIATFGAAQRAGIAAEGLGSSFEIALIQHKPAPACIFVQTPCQAALQITNDPAFATDRVRRIRIGVCAPAIAYPGCDFGGTLTDIQAARMSIQFSVAAVLVHRRIAVENWRDFANPVAASLSARCELAEHRAFTQRFPQAQGAAIEVELDGGQILSVVQDDLHALGRSELTQRLRTCAAGPFGAEQAAALIALAETLGKGVRVSALTQATLPCP